MRQDENRETLRNKMTSIKKTNDQCGTLREQIIERRKRVTTGRGIKCATTKPDKQVKTNMKSATSAAEQTTSRPETQKSTTPDTINFH